jgi:hypothetical protein
MANSIENDGMYNKIGDNFNGRDSAPVNSCGEKLTLRKAHAHNNFYVLREGEDGIARTPLNIVFDNSNFRYSEWKLLNPTDRAKLSMARSSLHQLLDVDNNQQIQELLKDPGKRNATSKSAYERLGNMYGIEGSENEIIDKIEGYGELANSTINSVIDGQLPRSICEFGMVNKIQATNNPVELALIMHDNSYGQRSRFEAKRKVVLMNLAGAIDQRERVTNINTKFEAFNDFLEQNVWSKDMKTGDTDEVYLLSEHDPKTNACMKVDVLTREQRQRVEALQDGQRITPLRRRRFNIGDQKIPIYANLRTKSPEAKILKLLRNGKEDPDEVVDDDLGLMGVLDNARDVRSFVEHLGKSAKSAGTMLTFENVEDSLNGGKHEASSEGSSPDVKMYKFHARWGGMRTENMLHTNQSYLDYMYKKDIAHPVYEVKRLIETGVIDLLFPPVIYGYNAEEMQEAALVRAERGLALQNL